MIDRVALDRRIREKAQLILNELTADNLNYFPLQAKEIAEAALENYTIEVYNHFTEGVGKIADDKVLSQFDDYLTGYRHQMEDWIEEHPIKIERVLEIPEKPVEPTRPMSAWVPVAVGGAVVVGLLIFAPVWAAFVAAVATALVALRQQNKLRQHDADFKIKLAMYEKDVAARKEALVSGLIADLNKWLDQGVEASNAILNKFGIE